jgi:hypothetical protein
MVHNTHSPSNTCKFSFNTVIKTHINQNWDSLTLFFRMVFDTWKGGGSSGGGGGCGGCGGCVGENKDDDVDDDDDDGIAYVYY